MSGEAVSGEVDGGQPRFVITGGADPVEVAAVIAVLSGVAAASAAAGSGAAAADAAAGDAVPDGRSRRPLWSVSLGPALRSAITWRTSGWW